MVLPVQGDGPREDIGYSDLFGPGVAFAGHYRYLLTPHISVMAEVAYATMPINSEMFVMLLDAGELEVGGGDLVQHRFSGGIALETNTIDKPNIVVKLLPSLYRTTPSNVVVTSGDLGVLQVNELSTIGDFGLNLGFAVELPVSKMLAIHAGADADFIPSSDLFSAQGSSQLINTTARAGFVIWF